MDFAEFLALFPERHAWPEYGNRDAFLTPVRRYQSEFAASIAELLAGGAPERMRAKYAKTEPRFHRFLASGQADNQIERVEADGEGLPNRYAALDEFAFVHLMHSTLPYWRAAIRGVAVNPAEVSQLQFQRAYDAVQMMKARERSLRLYFGPESLSPHAAAYRAYQSEHLAEYDLVLSLTELATSRPWLRIIASPAQFAQGPHRSAFLLLDVERREVVAVRVVAADGIVDLDAGAEDESTDAVVVVDSVFDLGNVSRVRLTEDDDTDVPPRSWPGLIAVRRIAELDRFGHDVREWRDKAGLLRIRKAARRLLVDQPDFTTEVLDGLREIVLGRFSREREEMAFESIGSLDSSPAGARFGSLEEALNAKSVPVENHALIERFTSHIGVEGYYDHDGFIIAERRDAGPPLEIHWGWSAGFVDESEARRATGSEDCWRHEPGRLWGVTHPTYMLVPGGRARARRAETDYGVCPHCFRQLPATGVCDCGG